ncbi:hypothetical protein [Arthrobacter sp. 35W]|uniref:hypothetical protein n=1 Tax=Arthrobacter sp. 35W TaxID=1132441 RepID=UPI0003FEDB09|nr:hypothetical protein [Arthrobacter sp. 35W]
MVNQPEPNQSDPSAEGNDDAVWRDLVARLEATDSGLGPAEDDVLPSPAQPGTAALDGHDADDVPEASAPMVHVEGQLPLFGPRDYEAQEDDGEFVPPEPPPLGSGEPAVVLAWIGAAGGPIALLLTALLWRSAPLVVVVGIIVAFVACAGYLVYRLPSHREDDGDDGAVV